MKVAFAQWNERIAAVFDTAPELRVLDIRANRIAGEEVVTLLSTVPAERVVQLVNAGIEEVICGAISRPLFELLAAHGIRVIPFVAGKLDVLIAAWQKGSLTAKAFAMPGCRGCGLGQRRKHARGHHGIHSGHPKPGL